MDESLPVREIVESGTVGRKLPVVLVGLVDGLDLRAKYIVHLPVRHPEILYWIGIAIGMDLRVPITTSVRAVLVTEADALAERGVG